MGDVAFSNQFILIPLFLMFSCSSSVSKLQFLIILILMGMSARFVASYRLFEGKLPVSAHDVFTGLLMVSGLFAFVRLLRRSLF